MGSSSTDSKLNLFEFLDSIGGVPTNNQNMDAREVNARLTQYFSTMTIDEILEELAVEFVKRPNGRVLKLIGFCYFHKGYLDHAIAVYQKTLEITSEDPIAVHEDLGRCYILKGDLETARVYFNMSYRYDFEFYISTFGPDFLFVTALGRVQRRPPIFGESDNQFSATALKIERIADAISIAIGTKRNHKSLASMKLERKMQAASKEYVSNPQKINEDIKVIRDTVEILKKELASM